MISKEKKLQVDCSKDANVYIYRASRSTARYEEGEKALLFFFFFFFFSFGGS